MLWGGFMFIHTRDPAVFKECKLCGCNVAVSGLVKVVTHETFIWKVTTSNHCRGTDYPDCVKRGCKRLLPVLFLFLVLIFKSFDILLTYLLTYCMVQNPS